MESAKIPELANRVIDAESITEADARWLFHVNDTCELARQAHRITRTLLGPRVDIEELGNIKKNACSEDCTFCAQSILYDTQIDTYTLAPNKTIVEQAARAKKDGASSYCLVAAWRQPPPAEFERVCEIISEINEKVGISVDCSLGFLTRKQAQKLKELDVLKYNHNLETSRSKFPEICTTHTYDDRINTLKIVKSVGLGVCTGGIIGMGETRTQRLELALEIATLDPQEVTINILTPMPGTPLELQTKIAESEIIRMFAVLRFLIPHATIRISGGREATLKDAGESILQSGANAIITEGYLTTSGRSSVQDTEMIRRIGLEA